MQYQHTGSVMLDMVFKFLDVVAPEWRVQLLSISTDRAWYMMRFRLSCVTPLCQTALEYMYLISNGAHQLDVVIDNCSVLC